MEERQNRREGIQTGRSRPSVSALQVHSLRSHETETLSPTGRWTNYAHSVFVIAKRRKMCPRSENRRSGKRVKRAKVNSPGE